MFKQVNRQTSCFTLFFSKTVRVLCATYFSLYIFLKTKQNPAMFCNLFVYHMPKRSQIWEEEKNCSKSTYLHVRRICPQPFIIKILYCVVSPAWIILSTHMYMQVCPPWLLTVHVLHSLGCTYMPKIKLIEVNFITPGQPKSEWHLSNRQVKRNKKVFCPVTLLLVIEVSSPLALHV